MDQTLSPPQGNPGAKSEAQKPSRHWDPRLLLIPIGLVLAGTGLYFWSPWSTPQSNTLFASGRLEGYETDIASKFSGRVQQITVREGDTVTAGQLLAQISDEEIQAQLRGAEARLAASQEQETQARLQLEVIQNQILEVQLAQQQARGDAQGRILQAQSNLAAAEATLAQAKAQAQQAQSELDLAQADQARYAQLFAEGAVSRQTLEQFQTRAQTTAATLEARQAAVETATKQVNAAEGVLVQSQTADLNPEIQAARLAALERQQAQTQSQLAATQANVRNAIATQEEIQSRLTDLQIFSPIQGVVTVRSVEPGAVVAPGQTLLTLLDQGTVYLRGYVPEGQIGRVRVGQAARVFLDSDPDQPLAAQVAAIDSQASFTPQNIYFQEDRVRQVFGIRITIDNPGGFAKPGMPADAEILLSEDP
jgi:HlyD family secretion protein